MFTSYWEQRALELSLTETYSLQPYVRSSDSLFANTVAEYLEVGNL